MDVSAQFRSFLIGFLIFTVRAQSSHSQAPTAQFLIKKISGHNGMYRSEEEYESSSPSEPELRHGSHLSQQSVSAPASTVWPVGPGVIVYNCNTDYPSGYSAHYPSDAPIMHPAHTPHQTPHTARR